MNFKKMFFKIFFSIILLASAFARPVGMHTKRPRSRHSSLSDISFSNPIHFRGRGGSGSILYLFIFLVVAIVLVVVIHKLTSKGKTNEIDETDEIYEVESDKIKVDLEKKS